MGFVDDWFYNEDGLVFSIEIFRIDFVCLFFILIVFYFYYEIYILKVYLN